MEARVPVRRRRNSAWLALACACLTPVAQAQTVSKDECIDANEAAQKLKRDGALTQARAKLQLCLHQECPDAVRAELPTGRCPWRCLSTLKLLSSGPRAAVPTERLTCEQEVYGSLRVR